mmetsp:Transcript_37141/g.45344  ORF Transcript_37141/g.45344 Transcript_37141/m.45344 type:complete len:167 (-) Transcript_37141:180-680(-)
MFFLRQRTILINLIAMTVIWIIAAFSFYVNNTFIKYVPGNFENNILVMTSTDIGAAFLAGLISKRYTAKSLFFYYSMLSFAASLLMLLLVSKEQPNWTVPIYVGLARAGVVSTFTTIYLKHPGLFPTLFAVTSMGITNFAARLFVIMAPMVAEVPYPIPVIILTIV